MLFLEPPPLRPVKSPSLPSPSRLLSAAAPLTNAELRRSDLSSPRSISHFSIFISHFHLFRFRIQAAAAAPYRVRQPPSPTRSSGEAIYLHRVCIFHFSFLIFHLFRLRLQAAAAASYRVTPYEVPKGTSAGWQPPHQHRAPEERCSLKLVYYADKE